MSPAIVLACGLTAIAVAIALLALTLLSARPRRDAAARALIAILFSSLSPFPPLMANCSLPMVFLRQRKYNRKMVLR